MAIQINRNAPVTTPNVQTKTLSTVNLAADFSSTMDKPGERRLTNVKSPVPRPQTVRYAVTNVKNVYSKGIDKAFQLQDKSGKSIVFGLTEMWSVTNDSIPNDPGFIVPVSGHMVLKLPTGIDIPADKFIEFATTVYGLVFDHGTKSDAKLNRLMRGSVE